MPEFIYQMRGVRKAHGDKVILDNVTLAFLVALYRAKDAGRDQVRIYAHATGNATENKDEATDACP